MFIILFFTIIGFLAGLGYVMIKRRVMPGKILTATLLGLLFVAIKNFYKNSMDRKKGGW